MTHVSKINYKDMNRVFKVLVTEGWASAKDNELRFVRNAQMWPVQHPINEFCRPTQKNRHLPNLIAGGYYRRPRHERTRFGI